MITLAAIDQFFGQIWNKFEETDNRPKDGMISGKEVKNVVRRDAGKPCYGYSELVKDVFLEAGGGGAVEVKVTDCKKKLDSIKKCVIEAVEQNKQPEGYAASKIWSALGFLDGYDRG
ncbi:MAG: hypothetical protein A2289_15455 [Deltaproteobacteria bacterium RIFOXYA12_FULL_58_15]|nr:MAG: hypothetical protein A2289_15455 [Deltaproteobacteria bacterium RIFOXYA12_FULL_58_15]